LFYTLLLVHLQLISVAYSLSFGMITLEVDEGDFYRGFDIRCIQKDIIFECEDIGFGCHCNCGVASDDVTIVMIVCRIGMHFGCLRIWVSEDSV